MRQWQALRIQRRQQPGVRTRDAGDRELLPVGSPGEIFLLCVLQHLRQGEIAVVVAQNRDHLRIRSGIRVSNGALRRLLAPIRSGLQPEDDRRILPAFAAVSKEQDIIALASARPRSSSSRRRLRSLFGAQATILAMSSCGIPRRARCRTFWRSASLTTKAVLAMDDC